jgi:hypothetical protein
MKDPKLLLNKLITDLAAETSLHSYVGSALDRRHLAIAAVQFVVCAAIDLGEDQTAIRNLEHRLLATIAKHTAEATKV